MSALPDADSLSGAARGIRGFELDIHVAFAAPLAPERALEHLLVLDGFRVELYQPHPRALRRGATADLPLPVEVPSARLTGPLRAAEQEALRAGLSALLFGPARYLEVGLRGFLRSSEGQTEWMPWRRVQVLTRQQVAEVAFEEGVRYVLE